MESLETLLDRIRQSVDTLTYPDRPAGLYRPIRYVLSLGGKRLRPLLTLLACDLCGGDCREALEAAVGLEIFHNFTLLHDDVMDRADLRRGAPTVHVKWGENSAILSGDAMQIVATMQLMKSPERCRTAVCTLFLKSALEICEGQQYDMEFEQRNDVTEAEYIEMIRLKTAVLLGCALKTGALIAGAKEADADALYRFGESIGLAFQLQDDYLDVYGDSRIFGKKTGGDILNNKKSYLLITALRLAEGSDREELMGWLSAPTFDPSAKIAAVTALYDRLAVGPRCVEKMEGYYTLALRQLDTLTVDPARTAPLRELAARLMKRNV